VVRVKETLTGKRYPTRGEADGWRERIRTCGVRGEGCDWTSSYFLLELGKIARSKGSALGAGNGSDMRRLHKEGRGEGLEKDF